MVVKYKALIGRHKEEVHAALKDLEFATNNCNRETPRAVAKALNTLREAVNDDVLYVEEENSYKMIISNNIKQFEENCGCNPSETSFGTKQT